MNKDLRLERLLRKIGQRNIAPPKDLITQTTQRMGNVYPATGAKGLTKIARNARPIVAAAMLLLLGFLGTWTALSHFSSPTQVAGGDLNLATNPRIIAAQEQLGLDLALPGWIPQDFSLAEVEVSQEDSSLTLVFQGPSGTEPLILVQAPVLNSFFPPDTKFVDFSSKEGLEAHRTRGCLYETRRADGTLTGRTMVLPYKQSFVYLSSQISPVLSRNPLTIMEDSVLAEIARSIVGTDKAESYVPEDEYQLAKDWGAIPPPPGLQYDGVLVDYELGSTPVVQLSLSFKDYQYAILFSQSRPETGVGVEELDIYGSTGYFREGTNDMSLNFQLGSAYVEITGPAGENSLTRHDFLEMARWIVNSQRINTIVVEDLGPITDYRSSFIDLAQDDVPSFRFGEIIELDFAGNPPDSVQLLDHLLTENGAIQYTEREIITREVALHGDKGKFPLERHFAVHLSSQFPAPPSLRGFRLICTWGEDAKEYTYVIRIEAP